MDEATRKALETHIRILMKQVSVIRALLDGDKGQTLTLADLSDASVAADAIAWMKQQATLASNK